MIKTHYKMLIFGPPEKLLKKRARKCCVFPIRMRVPISAPFVSFCLPRPSLSGFLTNVTKHMVFPTQDGPEPSKNGTRAPLQEFSL